MEYGEVAIALRLGQQKLRICLHSLIYLDDFAVLDQASDFVGFIPQRQGRVFLFVILGKINSDFADLGLLVQENGVVLAFACNIT